MADHAHKPATSLQPLITSKPNKKLSDQFSDSTDISLPLTDPKPTKSQTWDDFDNIRKQRHNRILFGVVILILTIIVIVFIILFTMVFDITDNASQTERKLLFISHPNSQIYTMDSSIQTTNNTIQSFCVDIIKNKFLYIGNKNETYTKCKSEIPSSQDINTSFTELELNANYAILPGLTDSHAHIMSYGAKFFQVDLRAATSITNLQLLIEQHISINNYSITDWILGWGWSQNSWTDWNETQLPTRWDLDSGENNIIRDYKLFLTRADGTSAIGNTAAIIAAFDGDPYGLTNAEDPEGGNIERDSFGNATGMLVGTPAMWLISNAIPSPSISIQNEMLNRVLNECSENGLTGIHDAGNGPAYIELYKNAIDDHSENITVRINAFASAYDDPADYILYDMYQGLLTVRSVKHYMDGSLGPWGASMIEPYCDDPSKSGVLRWNSVEEYYQNISKWNEYGFQICTHAIGDNANRIVIDSYERLINETDLNVTNHRLRIEHCQIINRTFDIPRVAELHIIPSMQPSHCTDDMVFAPDRLNCTQYGNGDRLSGAYAWQSLLDAGVDAMPFGSDFPAVGVVNPFLGIYAAVTRSNESGYPIDGYPMEYNKVSLYQAIKGYTIDAAYAAFQEDRLGSITEGKFADFIVIDRDLFDLDSSDYNQILDTVVLRTYLGGNIVFDIMSDDE
eukprot:304160_1